MRRRKKKDVKKGKKGDEKRIRANDLAAAEPGKRKRDSENGAEVCTVADAKGLDHAKRLGERQGSLRRPA